MATGLVNFGPVILLLNCIGDNCGEANICTALVKGHSLGGSRIASKK